MAGLLAALLGVSDGILHWQREVGFHLLDLWRIVTAAGVLVGLPTFLATLASAYLARLADESIAARALFWSTPVLAGGGVAILWMLSPASPYVPKIPWLLVGSSCALIVVIGWRLQLFKRAPGSAAPIGWLLAAVSFALIAATWGPARMHFKGPSIYLLAATMTNLILAALGIYGLRGPNPPLMRWGLLLVAGTVSVVSAAMLPWVLPDLYGYVKCLAVFQGAVATGYLAWVLLSETTATRQIGFLGSAGACLMTVSMVGLLWFSAHPVNQRFGAYSRASMVGLAAQAMSVWDDRDGDGFYAEEAGGNDPDDERAEVLPAALGDASSNTSRPTRPPPEPDLIKHSIAKPINHLLIVVVDAVRADIFNDETLRRRFSFLNRLETESVRFSHAYAPSSTTRLSLAPMLTGIEPSSLAARAANRAADERFISQKWLGALVEPQGNSALVFATNFRWMLEAKFPDNADVAVVDPTVTATGHSSPFLADHFDTLVDRGFFDTESQTVTALYAGDPHSDYHCKDGRVGGYECYLEEIEEVDDALERIYARLDEAGVLDETLLVVTADHGQSFGDLNYRGHASSLDEAAIRVGLMMRVPGEEHRVVDQPVSLTALPATAADALHRSPVVPQAHRSLLRYLGDDTSSELEVSAQPVMVEHWTGHYDRRPVHRSAFIWDGYKLSYDWHTTAMVLVDLSEPITAGSDLSHERAQLAERLRDQMFRWRRTLYMP